MIIHSVFAASTLSNIYMVSNDKNELIIIDPSEIREEMIKYIENNRLNLIGVLFTHLSRPIIAGVQTLEKIYPEFFRFKFETLIDSSSSKNLRIGSFCIKKLHINGLPVDSSVFRIENALFTGETLYAGKVANTESLLQKETIIKEIKEKIMVLDENTLIFPGQGPTSKIRIEKMFNVDLLSSPASYL